jgi:hypothetical protein
MAGHIDSRIEPIPVGLHRFETDGVSPLLTIARRESQVIQVEKVTSAHKRAVG